MKQAKPKNSQPMRQAMQQAGFSGKAAQNINDFWAELGVTGVRIGRKTLTVQPKKGKR